MVDLDELEALVSPIIEANGCRVYDVTYAGRTLKIIVDRDGGIGLDVLHGLARQLSVLLDERDPVSGSYTLEVTSPGLERKLTRPEHYVGAVGSEVSIKARDADGTIQRVRGRLSAAEDDGVVVTIGDDARHIPYRDITGARTVFEWGPAPKPGGSKKNSRERRADQEPR